MISKSSKRPNKFKEIAEPLKIRFNNIGAGNKIVDRKAGITLLVACRADGAKQKLISVGRVANSWWPVLHGNCGRSKDPVTCENGWMNQKNALVEVETRTSTVNTKQFILLDDYSARKGLLTTHCNISQ